MHLKPRALVDPCQVRSGDRRPSPELNNWNKEGHPILASVALHDRCIELVVWHDTHVCFYDPSNVRYMSLLWTAVPESTAFASIRKSAVLTMLWFLRPPPPSCSPTPPPPPQQRHAWVIPGWPVGAHSSAVWAEDNSDTTMVAGGSNKGWKLDTFTHVKWDSNQS